MMYVSAASPIRQVITQEVTARPNPQADILKSTVFHSQRIISIDTVLLIKFKYEYQNVYPIEVTTMTLLLLESSPGGLES